MTALVSQTMMADLSDYILSRMGMSFPRERWAELEKRIATAAREYGFADSATCIEWILSSRTDIAQMEMLSSCLTVGETFFFRENKGLQAIIQRAFPEIIRAHAGTEQRVRIWSAGCCTGEEPYTVAMMASDYPGLRGWEVSILATDINSAFLKKAEAGIYKEWSFRGVDPGIKDKYFLKSPDSTLAVAPSIKGTVTFAPLNLIDDAYPALLNNTNAIDLIVCRNVLMYFAPTHVQSVIQKLWRCLQPDGWLLVSPVEAPLIQAPFFTSIPCAGTMIHQKVAGKAVPVVVSRPQTLKPLGKRSPRKYPTTASGVGKPTPSPTLRRASELYVRADYDGAITMLRDLAELPAAPAEAYQLLSHAYANKGMLAEAEHWCQRATAADTLNAANRYLAAVIWVEQGRSVEAMSALRKALYLDPGFVVAHFALANLCRREGRHPESRRHLRNALRILESIGSEEMLPESEGMTAGKMADLIQTTRAAWEGI